MFLSLILVTAFATMNDETTSPIEKTESSALSHESQGSRETDESRLLRQESEIRERAVANPDRVEYNPISLIAILFATPIMAKIMSHYLQHPLDFDLDGSILYPSVTLMLIWALGNLFPRNG